MSTGRIITRDTTPFATPETPTYQELEVEHGGAFLISLLCFLLWGVLVGIGAGWLIWG